MTWTTTIPKTELLTISEVMKKLRVGRSTLFKLMSNGELKAKKLKGLTLFLNSDVEEFMSNLPDRTSRLKS